MFSLPGMCEVLSILYKSCGTLLQIFQNHEIISINHICSYLEFFSISGLDTGKSKLHKGSSNSCIFFVFVYMTVVLSRE